MAISVVNALKALFAALGCVMVATLIYTISIDGLPFRSDLLTPWMGATLVDFYINIGALGEMIIPHCCKTYILTCLFYTINHIFPKHTSFLTTGGYMPELSSLVTVFSSYLTYFLTSTAWICYKESNWISALLWLVLLVCLGSVTTCSYILKQLFELSPQESSEDPIYYVLLKRQNKYSQDVTERTKRCCRVVTARVIFSILGLLMFGTLVFTIVTDGSPFRSELFTPWLTATLVDFYINIVALSVWVSYKEPSWLSTFFWIALLICFGSVAACVYIVHQLYQLASQDPVYRVLLNNRDRAGNGYERSGDTM